MTLSAATAIAECSARRMLALRCTAHTTSPAAPDFKLSVPQGASFERSGGEPAPYWSRGRLSALFEQALDLAEMDMSHRRFLRLSQNICSQNFGHGIKISRRLIERG